MRGIAIVLILAQVLINAVLMANVRELSRQVLTLQEVAIQSASVTSDVIDAVYDNRKWLAELQVDVWDAKDNIQAMAIRRR